MAAPGTPFESPRACPFVALELDRDKRSDKPDYRHRCFAEPTPAPRSIAHQEAYCLSPNFPACPVFQDWAVRAAAQPVPVSGSSAAPTSGAAIVGGAAAAAVASTPDVDRDVADVEAETTPPAGESALADLPEDASVTPAGAEIAAAAAATTGMAAGVASSPPTFATTDWQSEADESQQLAAFDDPQAAFDHPHSSSGDPDAGYPEPPDIPVAPAFVPPPTQPAQPSPPVSTEDAAAAAAVPAFLAGRSTRPPMSRDEIVPSWEIDGRYGAEAPHDPADGGGSRLDGVLTAIAVIAILALGVVAVLFLPGLLGNKPSATHPPASFILPSTAPSALPSAPGSLLPSAVPSGLASAAPTTPASVAPVASPHLYKIKSGDSLARIANKFKVTVQQILDANPDITNPNNIFVGQIIVIPPSAPATP